MKDEGRRTNRFRLPLFVLYSLCASAVNVLLTLPNAYREGKEEGVKITNVESYPVWNGQRNCLFVVVDTDEGISGVGEAGMAEAVRPA